MRRLMTLASVCLLVGTAGAPPEVQDASPSTAPPPWFGGRVELPELGVAITLPGGWLGLDLGADIDTQVEAVITALGAGVPGFRSTPQDARLALDEVEAWAREHDEWGFLAFSAAEEVCAVSVLPRSWSLHDADTRAMVDTLYREGDCFSGYDGMELIGLPSGWAIVVRVDNVCDPQRQTLYSIVSGDRAAEVRCRASARPDDDWLSVVKSFEFLAQE